MEAVINNTKLIRRVNIFALLILAVCVCAVAFLCKNMWLHIACTAALFLVMTIPPTFPASFALPDLNW